MNHAESPNRVARERKGAWRTNHALEAELRSGAADVGCSRSLGSRFPQIELDTVAFAQHLDPLAVDGARVKEHFLAGSVSNESKSLVRSQCFDGSCHRYPFFLLFDGRAGVT
jgi:hypothetical protein